MSAKKSISENDIAIAAAHILHESFLEATHTETVLYVENDTLVRKTPNSAPVLVKHLTRRNHHLAKKITNKGTFKIRKRHVEALAE